MKTFFLLLVLCGVVAPELSYSLTLEEGLKIIDETGRDAKIARFREDAARGTVWLARAPLFLQLNAYANQTWLKNQPAAKTPFGVMPTSYDQYYTYGLSATQLLYDFGKTFSSIDAANYALKAKEIETQRARNRASLDFIIAYYDFLEADKLFLVAQEDVLRYEAHTKDTDAKLRAGVVTRNNLLEAEVRHADARQRLLSAESARALRASRVNSMLLLPLNAPLHAEETSKTPCAGIALEQAWSEAEAASHELKSIDAGILGQEKNIQAAQSEFYPSLFLQGGYQYQENQYVVHQDNWSLLAGVSINLSSGGATSSRIAMNRAELYSLKLTREKILDAVRLDVQNAYLTLQTSEQRIEVMKTSVAQAEENLRLSRLRFREGVGTAIEVLDAVTLLSTAQTNWWRARYDFERAGAGLLYAMGRELISTYAK